MLEKKWWITFILLIILFYVNRKSLSHFDCTTFLFILFQSMGSQSRAQIKAWDMKSQRRCPRGSRTDGPPGGMEANSSHWEGSLKLERLNWTRGTLSIL